MPSLPTVGTAFLVVAIILGAGVIFGALAGVYVAHIPDKQRKECRQAIDEFCAAILSLPMPVWFCVGFVGGAVIISIYVLKG